MLSAVYEKNCMILDLRCVNVPAFGNGIDVLYPKQEKRSRS